MKVASPPTRGTQAHFAEVFPYEEVCEFCNCVVHLESPEDVIVTDKVGCYWNCSVCGQSNITADKWEKETVIAELRARSARRVAAAATT